MDGWILLSHMGKYQQKNCEAKMHVQYDSSFERQHLVDSENITERHTINTNMIAFSIGQNVLIPKYLTSATHF